METSKKFIISLTAVAVVAVAAIVSLVVVLAAFTVTTTNQFTVSYTAAGVEANVTAQYKLADISNGSGTYTTIQSTTNQSSITFNREATNGGTGNMATTQSFKPLSNVAITKDKFFVLKYTIANTSDNVAINVSVSIPGTPDNFTMGYVYANNITDPTTKAPGSITTTPTFATTKIEANQTGYIYVVFAIANADIDATFTGTSTWTLTAA